MVNGLTLSSPTLIDYGQMSSTFCLRSKIGQQLVILGTCLSYRTHPSDRPRPDIGNFLSLCKSWPMSGRRRYTSLLVDSPFLLQLSNLTSDRPRPDTGNFLSPGKNRPMSGRRMTCHCSGLSSHPLTTMDSLRHFFVLGQKLADIWPS